MLTTIEGVYKDGKIELSEDPKTVEEGRVLVTFLIGGTTNGSAKAETGQMITFGMFPELSALTDEDFKAAEFHGDPDDGLDWS